MAQPIQIADFFARIGFKADTKVLETVLFQMKQLARTARDLRSSTKNTFNFRTDSRGLDQARSRIGATISEVRKLRTEIGLIRGANVNVNANVNRRGIGGGQGGSERPGGRFSMIDGGIGAGAMIRAGIAPVAATVIGTDIVKTSMQIDTARAALLSISPTIAEAGQQFDWLRNKADELGFVFLQNTRNYTNFVASGQEIGMSLTELQQIFSSTAKYARVMGLSNDDLSGTFRALQQMLSKSTVMSEELKGQLAERFPGAVGKAARAMKMTVPDFLKFMDGGNVMAKTLVPLLAQEFEDAAEANGAFAQSMKSTGAKLAIFQNQWNDLQDAFARSGFLVAVTKGVDALSTVLKEMEPTIKGVGEAFEIVAEFLEAVFNPAVLTTLGIMGFLYLAFAGLLPLIGATLVILSGLAAAVLIAAAPFIAWTAAIVSVIAIVEDLYVAMQGGESQFVKWSKEGGFLGSMADKFLWIAEVVKAATQSIKDFLIMIGYMDEEKKITPILADPKGFGNVTDMALGTGLSGSLFDAIVGGSAAGQPSSVMTNSSYGDFNNTFSITVVGSGDPEATARKVKEVLRDEWSAASIGLIPQ